MAAKSAIFAQLTASNLPRDHDTAIISFDQPSYAAFSQIVHPREVPRRSNLAEITGLINLAHAVAHIEYSAFDLALDSAYRFRNMPSAYYDDWISVASDEWRHFSILRDFLQSLESDYGQLPVHSALYDDAMRADTVLERMAVVPRYQEANGLDANPKIIAKLRRVNTNESAQLAEILATIYSEEIRHVQLGTVWFEYCRKKLGLPASCFFEIIDRHFPRRAKSRSRLNVEARLQAGFTKIELDQMSAG